MERRTWQQQESVTVVNTPIAQSSISTRRTIKLLTAQFQGREVENKPNMNVFGPD
jgi:hypothetical protein